MLSLRATLVATGAARLRRGGWSVDDGVDLVLFGAQPRRSRAALGPERRRAIEPASFVESGETPPPTAPRPGSLSGLAAPAAVGRADCERLRAWSRVSARPLRS